MTYITRHLPQSGWYSQNWMLSWHSNEYVILQIFFFSSKIFCLSFCGENFKNSKDLIFLTSAKLFWQLGRLYYSETLYIKNFDKSILSKWPPFLKNLFKREYSIQSSPLIPTSVTSISLLNRQKSRVPTTSMQNIKKSGDILTLKCVSIGYINRIWSQSDGRSIDVCCFENYG